MSYKIDITANQVSLRTTGTRTLYDDQGTPVEVPQEAHRRAVGLGDYETTAEYQAAVADLLRGHLPAQADVLAEVQAAREERDAAIAARDALQAQRAAAEAERDAAHAERDTARAERDAARAAAEAQADETAETTEETRR